MEIVSLLALAGACLAWRRWRQCSAAAALIQSIAAILVVLYIAAIAGFVTLAVNVTLIAGVVFLIVEGLRMWREPSAPPVPIGVVIGSALLFWLIHANSEYFFYDEFAHWGVFLRDMLALGALWGADSNAMHPRYLPGATLWQYFFAIHSARPEGASLLAQYVLLIAPLAVLWERLGWRQWAWIGGILVMLVVVLSNFGHGLTSLYVDHLLGSWLVGIVLNYWYEMRERNTLSMLMYALPLAVLLLIKTTGLFFVLAALGAIVLLMLFRPPGVPDGQRIRRAVLLPFVVLPLCLVILKSWDWNRAAAGVAVADSSASGIATNLMDGESIFTAAQQAELTRRFLDVFLHQQISKDEVSAQFNAFSYPAMSAYTDSFRLSTAGLLLVSLIVIAVIALAIWPSGKRREWLVVGSTFWLGAVAYIAVLFFGYRYVSGTDNGLLLSSYIRYAHSMLLPLVIICFAALTPAFIKDECAAVRIGEQLLVKRNSVSFAVLLALLIVFERPYLEPVYVTRKAPDFRSSIAPLADSLRSAIGPASVWVFFPNNFSNGFLGQVIQYQLSPGNVYVQEDAAELLSSPESLRESWKDWDYVWLAASQPEFDQALSTLLDQPLNERLFRVTVSSGQVELVPVPDVF